MTPRIGSLCSGYGGLDLAAETVFGAKAIWHSEIGPVARVLAERWPDTPNLGDLTRIDWHTVQPVDIYAAGYPCQPFSQSGKKLGVNDERHIWPHIAEGIRVLRPRFVVLENVAGHRRIGFDVVLGDLASLGYDAQWTSIRACDVGAPHERERLFVLATRPEALPHAAGERRDPRPGLRADTAAEVGRLFAGDSAGDPGFEWLDYAEAVAQWEDVTGRPAPVPVVRGPAGGTVPSARFIEWLQGLPAGWVTDVQGLSTEEQIEALGNGVVPQQAEAALRWLLGVAQVAA